jgi:hypothetical protein
MDWQSIILIFLSNHSEKILTMLLLCIGCSPSSYLLSSTYKGLFLKVLRLLFIHSLFNCSGEQSLYSSDVELQPMDIADDIMTYVEVCLVYWNK